MISKKIPITVAILLLTVFTSMVLWQERSPAVQATPQRVSKNTVPVKTPFASLDQKAKATKHGDPAAVRDLTDEAVTTFALADIPIFTQEGMKDRVARAEVVYRQRKVKGISEVKVAKTINELAERLALPEYTRVSVAMVRTARLGLMLELPNLMTLDDLDNNKQKKKIGSSISPFMSPLEATSLTLFLLQQKALNEDFQHSHEEFYGNIQRKQVQRWKEERARRDGASPIVNSQSGPSMQVNANAKTDEIRRALNKAVTSMDPDELLNLADSSLNTLGIER